MRPQRLRREVGRVAADPRHRRVALQPEAVLALDGERQLGPAHVVEAEAVVEQPQERPDRARGVVVLGLAEQQRRAPLDVAQVHVVAERRADDPPDGAERQHDLGLGVVPARGRMQADRGAMADRRHRLRLGEDLGVGADADLEILRPEPLGLQQRLDLGGLVRAGDEVPRGCRRSPRRRGCGSPRPATGSPAACSSITRSTIESAKVTPQALIACRSAGASSRRSSGPASSVEAAARSATLATSAPAAARTVPAGSSTASRSASVGRSGEVMSRTTPSRTVTSDGPMPGRQTRPISVASGSSGSIIRRPSRRR